MDTWAPGKEEIRTSLVDVFTAGLYKEINRYVYLPANVNQEQTNNQNQYLVHHQGQLQGPFDLDFIEAMILSGVYSPNVLIQRVGATSRAAFSQMFPSKLGASPQPQAAHLPARQATPKSVSAPSKPLSSEAKLAWAICVVGGLFLYFVFEEVTARRSSSPKQTSYAPAASPTPNRGQPPARPAFSQPAYTAAAPVYKPATPVYTPPAPTPPVTTYNNTYATQSAPSTPALRSRLEDSTQVYRDASGRTYRVPNSAYYALVAKKTALASEKQSLDRAESELQALADEIDRSRRFLDTTSQYAVDSFNRKVDHLNAMNDRLQDATNAYNRGVDAFNAELARVGTPIY